MHRFYTFYLRKRAQKGAAPPRLQVVARMDNYRRSWPRQFIVVSKALSAYIVITLLAALTANAAPVTDSLWKQVERAVQDGLPKTAIERLQKILSIAEKQQHHSEWLNALSRKITLESSVEGDDPVGRIQRMKLEIPRANANVKPLMQTILALWYWQYFEQNRWRFLSRTLGTVASDSDFTTWDLPRLFRQIDSLYHEALSAQESLLRIPVSNFKNFLEPGTMPAHLRPTVFDFVAFEALRFYTSAEQAGARPQDYFEIDAGSAALGTLEEFLTYKPNVSDSSSPHFTAIKLYQQLLKSQSNRGLTDARLDTDLHRLLFVKNVAIGENKNKRYIGLLLQIIRSHAKSEVSSMASYNLAQAYDEEQDLVKARETALEGYNRFRKSLGGKACKAYIDGIEAKELQLSVERAAPGSLLSMTVTYKNFTRLYIRAMAENWDSFMHKRYAYPGQISEKELEGLLRKKPVKTWQHDLKETVDYKTLTRTLALPELPNGYYRIFASWKPDFASSSMVQHAPIWVSGISYISKGDPGQIGAIVLDALSGEPLAGAEIKQIFRPGELFQYGNTTSTDSAGQFRFTQPIDQHGQYHLITKGNDRILAERLHFGSARETQGREQVVLFTDRALYRPGQTVHFKGICVQIDQKRDNYRVKAARKIEISFRDANYEEISRSNFTTNDFGSFSGTFVAPVNRLAGRMSIVSENVAGTVSIRIEEYKRPKFSVSIEWPSRSVKLGDTITVEGNALAYTGSSIDNALVRYRVRRMTRFPWWWGSWGRPQQPTAAQEIVHGETRSDASGKFQINFVAKPDNSIKASDDPTFQFTISADVIAADGETRSGEKEMSIGYRTFDIMMSIRSELLYADKQFSLSLQTMTLEGTSLGQAGALRIHKLKEPFKPVRSDLKQPYRELYQQEANGDSAEFGSNWALWPIAETVRDLNFSTKSKNGFDTVDLKLPAGIYKIEAIATEQSGRKASSMLPIVILPSAGSTLFPLKLPSVAKVSATTIEVGGILDVAWGTGYDSGRAFIEIEHRGKVIRQYWTKSGKVFHQFRFAVSPEYRGGFTVSITQVKENRAYFHRFPVQVPWSNKELQLSFSTFRDKLEPGAKETWRLKVKHPEGEKETAEMVAALYDYSLDQFVPHSWNGFVFFYCDYSSRGASFSNYPQVFSHWRTSWNKQPEYPLISYIQFPEAITSDRALDRLMGSSLKRAGGSGRGGIGYGAGSGENMDVMAQSMVEDGALHLAGSALDVNEASTNAGTPPKATTNGQSGPVQIRKNLQETAFFLPHLLSGSDGSVTMEFTIPEALTKWRFLGFAHDKACRNGLLTEFAVTSKELMIQPNAPRFLREGDEIFFSATITNASKQRMRGSARLNLKSLTDEQPLGVLMQHQNSERLFDIAPLSSQGVSWKLTVPVGTPPVTYTVTAQSGKRSDGESGAVPVISSRVLVSETMPLHIRGKQTKTVQFEPLSRIGQSKTLVPHRLTVQMTSNPSWYAIRALPYLIEFPYECSEQVFNRLYANTLAGHIANANPRIREVFNAWRASGTLKSNLHKNAELKSALLEETPWVLDAKNETEAMHAVGLLFEKNTLAANLASAEQKLSTMQLSDGAWPWFPGGRPDPFITLYVATGFGRLRHVGAQPAMSLAFKSLAFLDHWIVEEYNRIKDKSENNLSPLVAQWLYCRSFYLHDKALSGKTKAAADYYLKQSERHWLTLDSRMSQAHCALALHRFSKSLSAAKIVASLKERSSQSDEMGMFWNENDQSWWWHRAPVETGATMIEMFAEVSSDSTAVEECKIWLLKQKQTQTWKTTKATADAVYGLLMQGSNLLQQNKLVGVRLGDLAITPSQGEAGTGFYERTFVQETISPSMARIHIEKQDKGIAWGGVYYRYFEDIAKVKSHATSLSLKKELYIVRDTKQGERKEPLKGPLAVGDLVSVRVVLRSDRDMEYVHLKDMRGSGLEPLDVLSGYRSQDGLTYYQSTRDLATHFFIEYVRKGTYVFEYRLRVQHKGSYQSGMATLECMYAPEFSSHSGSVLLEVK